MGSSHTSKATRAWIAAHPRIQVTNTPKHASWLDMAEMWYSVLTRALLRRGEFTSRTDLADKITDFAVRYNRTANPWTWRYDARTDRARYRARHTRTRPGRRLWGSSVSPGPRRPRTLTRRRTPTSRTPWARGTTSPTPTGRPGDSC
ncbi:MAG TPA: hypothetical protein VIU11_22260 [Nakamurella sp.]